MTPTDEPHYSLMELQSVVILRGGPDQHEKLLRLAILESACNDLRKPPNKRIYDEAVEWICGDPTGITFEGVCLYLGLDAEATRDRLLQLAEQHTLKKRLRGSITAHLHLVKAA